MEIEDSCKVKKNGLLKHNYINVLTSPKFMKILYLFSKTVKSNGVKSITFTFIS